MNLAGLSSRRFFFAEAERRLAEGAPVGLILFDIDDFKAVNDTWGHLAGDRVLRDIGALFLRNTRHEDLIARYGGDESLILSGSNCPTELTPISNAQSAEYTELQWEL